MYLSWVFALKQLLSIVERKLTRLIDADRRVRAQTYAAVLARDPTWAPE